MQMRVKNSTNKLNVVRVSNVVLFLPHFTTIVPQLYSLRSTSKLQTNKLEPYYDCYRREKFQGHDEIFGFIRYIGGIYVAHEI